jgi:GAF domain-containing protein
MTREQRIVQTFVELADTMVDDFDVIDFLHRVSARCVELLDCDEAGVLLADAAGILRVMASSSERAHALELMQAQTDEGPCFECFTRGEAVSSEDLEADRGRWPAFSPAAVARGFCSVHALPMRVRGETVGALNLFRAATGTLDAPDVPVAQGMADIAAVGLMQERSMRESREVVQQLQGALTSRVLIEQAKGVLAERAQISLDTAFARMRGYARTNNLKISGVARSLLDGQLDPGELTRTSSGG